MLSYKMGENTLYNQKIIALDRENPFKKGTFEHICIEYVLENVTDLTDLKECDRRDHNKNLLAQFVKHKLSIDVSPWSYYNLIYDAIFLARSVGCVRQEYAFKSSGPCFAVFLESGFVNLLDNKYTSFLSSIEDETKRQELWEVAYIQNALMEYFHIPHFSLNQKNDEYHLVNMAPGWNDSIHTLPMMGVSSPSPNDDWVKIHSRGLFHHVGDEMAFILAAMVYGTVSIVSKDELGDLIVLASSGLNAFRKMQRVNMTNFDYIYGTPQGQQTYPTQSALSYKNEGDCIINDRKNTDLDNGFWNNDVFLKHAHREIKEYTVNEFFQVLKTKHKSLEALYPKEVKAIDILYNVGHETKDIEQSLRNSLLHEQAVNAQLYEASEHLYLSIMRIMRFIETCYELLYDFYSFDEKSITVESLELSEYNISKELKNDLNKLKEKVLFINTQKHILENPEFIEALNHANQCFYKTISHKVHCEIINPTSQNNVGFFLKNDGKGIPDKLVINIVLAIKDIFFKKRCLVSGSYGLNGSSKKLSLDTYIHPPTDKDYDDYFINKLNENVHKGDKYDELIEYWQAQDIKAFVVSELIDMQNEYRIFMIDNRPVTASPCFRNTTPLQAWQRGRFDPRLCVGHSAAQAIMTPESRKRVTLYAKFARQFGQEMKKNYPNCKHYVLDVAWSDEKQAVVPVEINTITWSGAYQINMHRLCAAIAKKPFSSEHLKHGGKSFNEMKAYAHQKMIDDGIIKNPVKEEVFKDDKIYEQFMMNDDTEERIKELDELLELDLEEFIDKMYDESEAHEHSNKENTLSPTEVNNETHNNILDDFMKRITRI